MIAQICISLVAALSGAQDQARNTVELYDLRWMAVLRTTGKYLPDAWRRGVLELDALIRDSSLLVEEHPITSDQLDVWMRERHPTVIWSDPRHGVSRWQHAVATSEAHLVLRSDLAELRALQREPVRVRWIELEPQHDLAAGVIDRAAVQQVLSAAPVLVIQDQRTAPGRSLVLRTRESSAYIVDYDMESLSEPPTADPQVGVQRVGPEAVVMLQSEPDGAWDVRLVVQDAEPLAPRATRYPDGGNLIQLPELQWTTLCASARVPDGGGFVFEGSSGEHESRWLFTVENVESRAVTGVRFRRLGRLARRALAFIPDFVSTVSMSGGESWTTALSWPLLDHWEAPYEAQDLDIPARLRRLGLTDDSDVPLVLGSLIDLGAAPDQRALRMLDELANHFPTYHVELRSVREPATGRTCDSEHSAPNSTIVSTAVRAGDLLAISMLTERAYVRDADIEISGLAMGPDPILTGLSRGVTALVRCLPTRHGSIDVACRVKDVSTSRASTIGRCVIRNNPVVNEYIAELRGTPLPETLSYEIELPQQSLSDVRAKLIARPGEWELVGSTLIADSADQLTVWVRVTEIAP